MEREKPDFETSQNSANTEDYRSRIYKHYISSRNSNSDSGTFKGLRTREGSLKKLIREHFPSNQSARIIDLGCGNGTLIHFARQMGYENIKGVDNSREQVQEALRIGIEGIEQGDLMQSLRSLPEGSQDAVITYDVIEHFTKVELLPFVDEVKRVLRIGGRWILHLPNALSPFFGRIRYGDITHELAFTSESISQLLISSQFSEVQCFEDTIVIHGGKSLMRWLLWKLIRNLLRIYIAAETGEPNGIFTQNFLTIAIK